MREAAAEQSIGGSWDEGVIGVLPLVLADLGVALGSQVDPQVGALLHVEGGVDVREIRLVCRGNVTVFIQVDTLNMSSEIF